MDMEALVLGLMNARLTEKALSSASSAERESVFMEDSTRRAFDSRMKGDARVARQASQNMQDAQTMVNVAQTAATTIKEQLTGIQKTLHEAALRDNVTETEFQGMQTIVNDRIAEILRLAENTEFNGMKLMNGSAGTNGVVEIQAGNSVRPVSLMNLLDRNQDRSLGDGSSMNLYKLSDELDFYDSSDPDSARDNAAAALETVESLLDAFRSLENRYSHEYKSLGNMSLLFEEQADIFDQARTDNAAMTTSTGDASSDASYLDRLLTASGQSSILSGTT